MRTRRGAPGAGGAGRGGVAGVSLSVQGGRGGGAPGRGLAPPAAPEPEAPRVGGRGSASAPGPSCALSSPASRCAALAPHVLFGWVSNGGRGGSAAGLRLQGGTSLGPRASAWGKYGRFQPSGDVSRPYLRSGDRSDGGDARWASLGGNTIRLLASRQRSPFPRLLPGSRLGVLRLLPPDFAFHVGFGPKYISYAFLLRFTYVGLLVLGWAVIIEGPNLLDLLFPSLPPPGGKGLVLTPG